MAKAKLELDVEYARLFLGVIGKPPHPSESVYASGLMMQKERNEVLFAYRKAGVDKEKEYTQPEDHIAIELKFMAHLCQKTAEASQKGEKAQVQRWVEMQKEFINKHLSVWVPKLTNDILDTSRTDFYTGAAKISEAFIEMDKLELGRIEVDASKQE